MKPVCGCLARPSKHETLNGILKSLRQKPRLLKNFGLAERPGGTVKRESKAWKSAAENQSWLLPEVVCLCTPLSADVRPSCWVRTPGSLVALWYPAWIQYVKCRRLSLTWSPQQALKSDPIFAACYLMLKGWNEENVQFLPVTLLSICKIKKTKSFGWCT